jgi:hypothetical protein
MTALGVLLLILSALFVSALMLELVACGRRRWRTAVRLSRILAFAGPISIALALAAVVARDIVQNQGAGSAAGLLLNGKAFGQTR